MSFDNWDESLTINGELLNNLILVDNIIAELKLQELFEFHILGGAALILNDINYNTTLDIDVANPINEKIKEAIEPFINDMASSVAILPVNYIKRLRPFKEDILKNIMVFTLSNEDIVFTKLSSDRRKDLDQLKHTNVLEKTNISRLEQIIETECTDPIIKLKITARLNKLL